MENEQREPKWLIKLTRKANREFNLTECPKCGDEMEYGAFNYNSTDYEAYFECKKCGIRVTHIYDWNETVIEGGD